MKELLDRIHWPQAILFAVFLVCIVSAPIAFLVLVPERTQDKLAGLPWETIIGVGLPMLGVALSGFLAPFMRPVIAKTEPDSKSPSTPPPRSSRAGFASIDALLLVLSTAGVVFAALALHGCGSALTTQARAATIASIAVGSIGAELHDVRATALDACEADAVPLHCESEQTSAWAPAVAAYESARLALSTWIDALDVARQAGTPDGDVLGALFVAVSRLAREWNQLAEALRAMRPDWPDLTLPPIVVALATGAAS